MNDQNNISTFDALCQAYSTWVIKYCSPSFKRPLYFVWYTDTDENDTDRLLTFKDGCLLAVNSTLDLTAIIQAEIENLTPFENLPTWLSHIENMAVEASYTYDVTAIQAAIGKGDVDALLLENFTDFLNLYGDYAKQDKRNSQLQVQADSEIIKRVWNYYYDFIFWPNFNDKERFGQWERPILSIDTTELLLKLADIIKSFEGKIRLTQKPSANTSLLP